MTVTTPYSYVNGQVLDPDGHNGNVYSTTPGQGVVSEINGGLNTFTSDFKIQKEHVWPEQATRARQESALESIDVFSDAFSETGDTIYRAVAGCAVRMYLPYASTLSLWQWSVFVHPFHVLPVTDNNEGQPPSVTSVSSNIFIRARLNGTNLDHTKRPLPTTAVYTRTNTPAYTMDAQESRFSLQFDMSHLQEDVSAGWHDLSLTMYMEPLFDGEDENRALYTSPVNRLIGPLSSTSFGHTFYQRASFGIRNARVLTLL